MGNKTIKSHDRIELRQKNKKCQPFNNQPPQSILLVWNLYNHLFNNDFEGDEYE